STTKAGGVPGGVSIRAVVATGSTARSPAERSSATRLSTSLRLVRGPGGTSRPAAAAAKPQSTRSLPRTSCAAGGVGSWGAGRWLAGVEVMHRRYAVPPVPREPDGRGRPSAAAAGELGDDLVE